MLTYQDVLDAKARLDDAKAKLAELSEDYDAKDRAADVPPEMHGEWVAAGRERDAAERALWLMADAYLTQCATEAYSALYAGRDRLAGRPLWHKRTAALALGCVPTLEGVRADFGGKCGLTLSYDTRALTHDALRYVTHDAETDVDPESGRSDFDRRWFSPAERWPEPSERGAGRDAADVMADAADLERRLDAVSELRADYVSAVRDLAAPYVSNVGDWYRRASVERMAFNPYDGSSYFSL